MTQFTNEEKDEAQYLAWVERDGPKLEEEKNEKLARQSLKDEFDGWEILSANLKSRFFEDVATIEAVVRKGDVVKIIFWLPFNKGWMAKGPNGSTIFKPQVSA